MLSLREMTSRLKEQTHFINVLLSSSKLQTVSLLKSVNKPQALVIWEITLNVLNNNLLLSPYYKRKLSKSKAFYKQLGDKRNKYEKKINLIRRNPDLVYNLIKAVRVDLLSLTNGDQNDSIKRREI